MKKVILGVGMLISGVIGISNTTVDSDIQVFMIMIYTILAVAGLLLGIMAIREDK